MFASVEISALFRESREPVAARRIVLSPGSPSNGHAVVILTVRNHDGYYEVDADEFERAVCAMRILADREVFLAKHNKA